VLLKIRAKEKRVKLLVPKNNKRWESETRMADCFEMTLTGM